MICAAPDCKKDIHPKACYVTMFGVTYHWLCWIVLIHRADLPANPKLEVRVARAK